MAKLYFRYGTVGSAKTMNLLAVAHNYRQQGKNVILLKPAVDIRFGKTLIRSRSGLEAEADELVGPDWIADRLRLRATSCVLVDEAQFLTPAAVDELRTATADPGVPVICYGLRTDFLGRLFDGSRRLLELADSIEEIKVTCAFCNKKAILNMRLVDGVPVSEGPQVLLGGDESYAPACYGCYRKRLGHPPGLHYGMPDL